MSSESELLATRYGKTATSAKLVRTRIIALAAGLLVVFVVWAVWSVMSSNGSIKSQVLGYDVISAEQTSVKFTVNSPSGPAICAIQALNEGFGVVGYREVEVASSGEYETFVNTTELAVTGLVDKCWLK